MQSKNRRDLCARCRSNRSSRRRHTSRNEMRSRPREFLPILAGHGPMAESRPLPRSGPVRQPGLSRDEIEQASPDSSQTGVKRRKERERWLPDRRSGSRKFHRGPQCPIGRLPGIRPARNSIDRAVGFDCEGDTYPPARKARTAPKISGATFSRSPSRSRRTGTRSFSSGFNPVSQA
jgi:hypothetical protein